jgi:hypothetical protein
VAGATRLQGVVIMQSSRQLGKRLDTMHHQNDMNVSESTQLIKQIIDGMPIGRFCRDPVNLCESTDIQS